MKTQVIVSKKEYDDMNKTIDGLYNRESFDIFFNSDMYNYVNHYLFKEDVDKYLKEKIKSLEEEIKELKQRKWYKLW